jgi:hypothetical protein
MYFCNIWINNLQHSSKSVEIPVTYTCNEGLQHNVTLLLGQVDTRRCGELDADVELAGAAAA